VSEVPARSARLDGWKEIASYLHRDVRTVQRWEKTEGLPIHRHQHQQRAVPFAFARELDEWRRSRQPKGAPRLSRARLVAGAAAVTLLLASTIFLLSRRSPKLTDRDSILIAAFQNSTGEPVFDGTLPEAVAAGLGESPFLDVVPAERVRDTLQFMGRSPDELMTEDEARDACQRLGAKAFVGGSIAPLGSHYVVAIHVRECQTGESIAREQVDVEGRERVLHALGDLVLRLRARLGESLASIKWLDAPLEQPAACSIRGRTAFPGTPRARPFPFGPAEWRRRSSATTGG